MICFKCNRDLEMGMFKSQSRSGATKRMDIPRQCLDCFATQLFEMNLRFAS